MKQRDYGSLEITVTKTGAWLILLSRSGSLLLNSLEGGEGEFWYAYNRNMEHAGVDNYMWSISERHGMQPCA